MSKKKATTSSPGTKKDSTRGGSSAGPKTSGRRGAGSAAGGGSVRVRMYRQGLGDCFLLTFHLGDAKKQRHVLIDCGTLGAKTTGVSMKDVVADIRDTTGGALDLLIATHEHLDHVSGFRDQRKTFEKDFTVARVWMAWTEDPKDDLARKIAKHKQDLGRALAAVVAAPGAAEAMPGVVDLLGFFGTDHMLGAGSFAKTVNDAMHFVRTGLGAETEYLRPRSTPIEPDWLPGLRFYVLGPPRDEGRLRETGTPDSRELYHLIGAMPPGDDAAANGGADLPASGAAEEAEMPFDRRFRCAPQAAATCFPGYFADEHQWRTIEHEYLGLASEFALQLDSITNNTSLALAIERIADGKVLLFPADAQLGSWLSWGQLSWTVRNGRGSAARSVTMADLFARTVFYKVGHHGSHNATVRKPGLEQMKRTSELTAFIPVDRQVALGRNPKGSWQMPAVSLYRRLLDQCQGRVVRSDLGWAAEGKGAAAGGGATEAAFRKLATAEEWKAWKRAQASARFVDTSSELYVDYHLT